MIYLSLTSGDPSGIGPEIILRFLVSVLNPQSDVENQVATYIQNKKLKLYLIGTAKVFEALIQDKVFNRRLEQTLCDTISLSLIDCVNQKPPSNAGQLLLSSSNYGQWRVPFIQVGGEWREENRGKVNSNSGFLALNYLIKSIDLVKADFCHGIVTAPVNKKAISMVQEGFIGHTEYFAQAFGVKPSMCFLSPNFNLVLMSTHVAIKDVPQYINIPTIKQSIQAGFELQKMVGDRKKLLVLGLNPHAGELGLMGNEDEVIKKVIEEIDPQKKSIIGPISADSAFIDVVAGRYRTVIACYHDQGLIPLKMLAKGLSVNMTLNLPCARTSVDHGTAFDIANDFIADHQSLVYAIERAYAFCVKKIKS